MTKRPLGQDLGCVTRLHRGPPLLLSPRLMCNQHHPSSCHFPRGTSQLPRVPQVNTYQELPLASSHMAIPRQALLELASWSLSPSNTVAAYSSHLCSLYHPAPALKPGVSPTRLDMESNEKKLSQGCESQEEEILSVLRDQGCLSKEEGQGKQRDQRHSWEMSWRLRRARVIRVAWDPIPEACRVGSEDNKESQPSRHYAPGSRRWVRYPNQ